MGIQKGVFALELQQKQLHEQKSQPYTNRLLATESKIYVKNQTSCNIHQPGWLNFTLAIRKDA